MPRVASFSGVGSGLSVRQDKCFGFLTRWGTDSRRAAIAVSCGRSPSTRFCVAATYLTERNQRVPADVAWEPNIRLRRHSDLAASQLRLASTWIVQSQRRFIRAIFASARPDFVPQALDDVFNPITLVTGKQQRIPDAGPEHNNQHDRRQVWSQAEREGHCRDKQYTAVK